jgi:hypothetical protein
MTIWCRSPVLLTRELASWVRTISQSPAVEKGSGSGELHRDRPLDLEARVRSYRDRVIRPPGHGELHTMPPDGSRNASGVALIERMVEEPANLRLGNSTPPTSASKPNAADIRDFGEQSWSLMSLP